jgi:hypothetical protein
MEEPGDGDEIPVPNVPEGNARKSMTGASGAARGMARRAQTGRLAVAGVQSSCNVVRDKPKHAWRAFCVPIPADSGAVNLVKNRQQEDTTGP